MDMDEKPLGGSVGRGMEFDEKPIGFGSMKMDFSDAYPPGKNERNAFVFYWENISYFMMRFVVPIM